MRSRGRFSMRRINIFRGTENRQEIRGFAVFWTVWGTVETEWSYGGHGWFYGAVLP